MKKIILYFVLTISALVSIAQNSVLVTEQTFKVPSCKEEIFYFGFAKGDKIILSFQEKNNNKITEFEIIEYPDNKKYSDFKVSKIQNKVINVTNASVYKFRFYNNSIAGRIITLKVERIPISDLTSDFNTNINWITKQDTTWNVYTKDFIVSYDTIHKQVNKKVLISTEKTDEMFMEKNQVVHSKNNLNNPNRAILRINFPNNESNDLKSREIISWAYWIGVGNESNEAWSKNVQSFKTLTSGTIAYLGANPLAGLALGTMVDFILPTTGEDVIYFLFDDENDHMLYENGLYTIRHFDSGKGIVCKGNRNDHLKGFYIGLENDNQIAQINVNIKLSIIWETKIYEYRTIDEIEIKPIIEKRIIKDPVINTNRIPCLIQD
jgi:uncharacterized protein with FMN-binding domain